MANEFPETARPRVVLADDHPAVLAAFGRVLETFCDVVARVPNGAEAVEAVTRLRPDVLVVDLMMPDLDGVEVCRRVKQLIPGTCVVIITASDDANIEKAASEAGASAFVDKFAAATTLKPTIERISAFPLWASAFAKASAFAALQLQGTSRGCPAWLAGNMPARGK